MKLQPDRDPLLTTEELIQEAKRAAGKTSQQQQLVPQQHPEDVSPFPLQPASPQMSSSGSSDEDWPVAIFFVASVAVTIFILIFLIDSCSSLFSYSAFLLAPALYCYSPYLQAHLHSIEEQEGAEHS